MAGCGAEGPRHTSSQQITCEPVPLNDRPLHYWLPVCTRFQEIHLKANQGCFARQEAGALAHRVTHSGTCTLRGFSRFSQLLPFKKKKGCLCVFICVCERERESTISIYACQNLLMYTFLFEQAVSAPVLLVPCGAAYDQSEQACVRPGHRHEIWTGISYREMTVQLGFYCTTRPLSGSWNVFAQSSLWTYFDRERRNDQQAS